MVQPEGFTPIPGQLSVQFNRHSDPTIGGGVNALARKDADISLANPVGIYFAGLNTAGWASPDGTQPALFWKITRGTAQKAVRAIFEVPADRGYLVSDVTINGKPIRYGAQIADFISMKLTGVAMNIGKSVHPPIAGCKSRAAKTAGLTKIDVASTLHRPAAPTRY